MGCKAQDRTAYPGERSRLPRSERGLFFADIVLAEFDRQPGRWCHAAAVSAVVTDSSSPTPVNTLALREPRPAIGLRSRRNSPTRGDKLAAPPFDSRNDNEVVTAPAGIFVPEFECPGHRGRFSHPTPPTRDSSLQWKWNHRRKSS
jgi:hypothetical protein